MENLNLNDLDKEDITQNEDQNSFPQYASITTTSMNEKLKKTHISLSNPIFIEMINFTTIKNDIEYEFMINYKAEKWQIKRNLSEIKNLIFSLQSLHYSFIPDNYFQSITLPVDNQASLKDININIIYFLRYLSYRFDVLSNPITKEFFYFNKCSDINGINEIIQNENLEIIYSFKIDESDLSISDFLYNPDLGLLLVSLEDVSILSNIGRFWSLIDYEILGNFLVFQRFFDKNNRPYFTRLIAKNFDVRISRVELSLHSNKIFVGLDNGAVQIFQVNVVDKSSYLKDHSGCDTNDKIIAITEGINFQCLTDRITGLASFNDFLFITSRENKLVIVKIIKGQNQTPPEILFKGSVKKRIEGKGNVCNIQIDPIIKKLFILTVTNKILVYDILLVNKFKEGFDASIEDVKIEFVYDIDCISNIKNIFIKNSSLFVALEDKIQIFNLKKLEGKTSKGTGMTEEESIIALDGSIDDKISYSSKYIKITYINIIQSICYFTDMKLVVLGLKNGTLLAFSARSFEVIFAKRISEHAITKLILLEDNYVVIAGDEKGNTFFMKFGI